jgi:hypothetical protein
MVFSKKEMEFAGKLSPLLNGARVSLKKTATSSTSEGSFKKYDIEIEGLPLDTPDPDMVLLGARSIPAYIFYEDTVADPGSYKYVEVTVRTKDKQYQSRYTPHQLQQVHESFITMLRFINAMKDLNSDSLSYYIDTTTAKDFSAASFIDKMKGMDAKYGTIQNEVTKAFKFDQRMGKHLIYFRFGLHRTSAIQPTDMWVDPVTNKVAGIHM